MKNVLRIICEITGYIFAAIAMGMFWLAEKLETPAGERASHIDKEAGLWL